MERAPEPEPFPHFGLWWRTTSAFRASLRPVPAVRSLGMPQDLCARRGLFSRFSADIAVDRGAVAPERDDLRERRSLLQSVDPIRRCRDEREVHGRAVAVGVDDTSHQIEDGLVSVQRWDEETAPARRRRDGPVVVELAGRAGLLRTAGDLIGMMVAHHNLVELPARVDGASAVQDLEPNGCGDGEDPARRHGVQERQAALDREAVVGGCHPR